MAEIQVMIPTFCRPLDLHAACQSVASQTFRDFRAHISDNASQDSGATTAVAQYWLSRDARFSYSRYAEGISMHEHYADLIRRSECDLVLLLADDDVLAPQFLEVASGLLRSNPSMVAAMSGIWLHDLSDASVRYYETYRRAVHRWVGADSAVKRQAGFLRSHPGRGKANLIQGLWRQSVLSSFSILEFESRVELAADQLLVFSALSKGPIGLVDAPLYVKTLNNKKHYGATRSTSCMQEIRAYRVQSANRWVAIVALVVLSFRRAMRRVRSEAVAVARSPRQIRRRIGLEP